MLLPCVHFLGCFFPCSAPLIRGIAPDDNDCVTFVFLLAPTRLDNEKYRYDLGMTTATPSRT